MKLHPQALSKILNLIDSLGGHRDNVKLKNALSGMDFTEYTNTSGETTLVETQEYLKEVQRLRGQRI